MAVGKGVDFSNNSRLSKLEQIVALMLERNLEMDSRLVKYHQTKDNNRWRTFMGVITNVNKYKKQLANRQVIDIVDVNIVYFDNRISGGVNIAANVSAYIEDPDKEDYEQDKQHTFEPWHNTEQTAKLQELLDQLRGDSKNETDTADTAAAA